MNKRLYAASWAVAVACTWAEVATCAAGIAVGIYLRSWQFALGCAILALVGVLWARYVMPLLDWRELW